VIRNYFGNGKKWNVNITYVHEDLPLGTGGALGLVSPNIPQLPTAHDEWNALTGRIENFQRARVDIPALDF
tara:strand:+ start:13978 stop:14190 length:213 start_codon:yes stop_codon:yes gene_type:complete